MTRSEVMLLSAERNRSGEKGGTSRGTVRAEGVSFTWRETRVWESELPAVEPPSEWRCPLVDCDVTIEHNPVG